MRKTVLPLLIALCPIPALAQDEAAVQQEAYVTIMSLHACSMTKVEMATEMQKLGLDEVALATTTDALVAQGAAVVTDEADGGARVTLSPPVCVPYDLEAHKALVIDGLLAFGCTMPFADLAALEAGTGLAPEEFTTAFSLLEFEGIIAMDPDTADFSLTHKDCP